MSSRQELSSVLEVEAPESGLLSRGEAASLTVSAALWARWLCWYPVCWVLISQDVQFRGHQNLLVLHLVSNLLDHDRMNLLVT